MRMNAGKIFIFYYFLANLCQVPVSLQPMSILQNSFLTYLFCAPANILPFLVYNEQNQIVSSPASRQLADFEDYSRKELPRLVRARLEEIVSEEMQPMEESLKSKLFDLIRESQQSLLDEFKSRTTSSTPTQPDAMLLAQSAPGRPAVWSAEFSNQMIARDFPEQSNSLPTSSEAPNLQEKNYPLDLLSCPPLLDNHSAMAQDLDYMLPTDAPQIQASDSGYGSTMCICASSSSQVAISSGPMNAAESFTQPSRGLTPTELNTAIDETGNVDFVNLWWNQDSSANGFDLEFPHFEFPKCGNCGGDVLDFDPSSYFVDL